MPHGQASCDVQHNVLLKYRNPPPNGGSCSRPHRERARPRRPSQAASTPLPGPRPSLPEVAPRSPVSGGTRDSRVGRALVSGGPAGAGSAGSWLRPRGFRRRHSTSERPFLCRGRRGRESAGPSRARPARGPTQASPLVLKVWLCAQTPGSCGAAAAPSILSPGQVAFPKDQSLFSPPTKLSWTVLSHPRLFQAHACETQPWGTFEVAVLRFVNLAYNAPNRIPNAKDTSLLKEKGHRT